MLRKRVIPCLDVTGGRVVKGVRFVDLVDEGDPVELAERYVSEGADEICFLDITASSDRRHTMLDVVRRTAENVFVPLTVGGGIRSVADMRAALRAGADKVSVNTAAVERPSLVSECSRLFGRQCVVLAVDARLDLPPLAGGVPRPDLDGRGEGGARIASRSPSWEVVTHGGRRPTGRDLVEWVTEAVERGAGEILLTSMDRDGTGDGYDLDQLEAVRRAVPVPLIASGGAGRVEHCVAALAPGRADAVLAASIFHRRLIEIADLKAGLAAAGVPTRLEVVAP